MKKKKKNVVEAPSCLLPSALKHKWRGLTLPDPQGAEMPASVPVQEGAERKRKREKRDGQKYGKIRIMKKGEREKENRRSGGEAGGEMGKGF